MKNVILILLYSLLTISFMGEAGIWSLNDQAKIEVGDDKDSEKEVKEKDTKKTFKQITFFIANNKPAQEIKPSSSLELALLHISYEVDKRPPRA